MTNTNPTSKTSLEIERFRCGKHVMAQTQDNCPWCEIERLQGELKVQKAVVDMAYIPHRHLVEQRDRADHQFKNFHRLLCERFGYVHDEHDWRRDQLSLIEHIAKRLPDETSKAPFPYPCDLDGWICSVCHGWNVPKDRVCKHSHLPLELRSSEEPRELPYAVGPMNRNPWPPGAPLSGAYETGYTHGSEDARAAEKASETPEQIRARINAAALADAHRMYELEHGEPFPENGDERP